MLPVVLADTASATAYRPEDRIYREADDQGPSRGLENEGNLWSELHDIQLPYLCLGIPGIASSPTAVLWNQGWMGTGSCVVGETFWLERRLCGWWLFYSPPV